MEAEFLTVLPQNDIADACIRELRYFGVDTKKIVRGDGRMGIYYLETGANQLPSKVVYDRAYSSIAIASPAISTGARRLRAWTGFTSRESHPQSRNLQWN